MEHTIPKTGRANPSKALRVVLALALLLGLVPSIAMLGSAERAYADDAPYVGMTMSGTCHIGGNWDVVEADDFKQTYFDVSGFSGVLASAGNVTLHCLDHTAAVPYEQDAPYEATVTAIDESTGTVTVDVRITPEDPTDGHTSNSLGLIGYQHVGGAMTYHHDFSGDFALQKRSSNPSLSDGNGCYSLEGAVYGVYRDAWCSDMVCTLTTDANGYARSPMMTCGTYYLRELSAPRGYALSDDTVTVTVGAGSTNVAYASDRPQNDPAYAFLQKYDGERSYTAQNLPQGSATLAGAEYTVRYYAGYYSSATEAQASGTLKRTWVIRTDADGFCALDDAYKVGGDAFYYNGAGDVTIPLGTVLIQETKAPVGYLLGEQPVFLQQVTSQGYLETVTTYNAPIDPEQVIRGGVSIAKRDAESKLTTPLGGASLDGTLFEIVNHSANSVLVGGVEHAPGEVVMTVSAEDGIARTATDALPYGEYGIREVLPGAGYLLSDEAERSFSIRENGAIIELDGDSAVYDQVKRGDIAFVKVRESDQQRLSHVPFRVRSLTTGEEHILVTDENGYASTASSWNAHSTDTNANDAAVGDGGEVDESALDPFAGVWFGLTTEGWTVEVDDGKCALPYDTYVLDEVPCTANLGCELVSLTFTVSRDGVAIDYGSVDDQPAGSISIVTTARDGEDGDRDVSADTESTVIDRVRYTGLSVGTTYVVTASLMDKETGEPVRDRKGDAVSASRELEAESASGYVELSMTFDSRMCAGDDLVVFETLTDAETGSVVANEADLDDFDQTVRVTGIGIGTVARDAASGTKSVVASEAASVIDTVSYANLTPGVEYVMEGALMVVDEQGATPLLDAAGDPVASSVAFTPVSPDGSVEVPFDLDASELAGARLVVFEHLSRDGEKVAEHADPDDEGQQVLVAEPRIGTSAHDGRDGDARVASEPQASVVDTIRYENLIEGATYEMVGLLVDPATGYPLVLSDAGLDGARISSVSEELAALFGLSMVEGDEAHDAASDEANDDATEAEEEDAVEPMLQDPAEDEDESSQAAMSVIAETLPFSVDEDALSGFLEENADVLDALVSASTRFVAEGSSGTVDVTFELDPRAYDAEDAVVYEVCLRVPDEDARKVVAVHADPDSVEQTVSLGKSTLNTTACEKDTESHLVAPMADRIVTDTVEYTDLVPGLEYELRGRLMDKATGEPYTENERAVEASLRFTPNMACGSVALDFGLDGTVAAGRDLVVFEQLYKDDELIAEHADIESESQTVSVTVEPEDAPLGASPYAQTGRDVRAIAALVVLLVLGGASVGICAVRRMRRHEDASERPSVAGKKVVPKHAENSR